MKSILESEIQSSVFIIALISVLCLGNMLFGFNLAIFLLTMICSFLISLKNPRSGLYAIIFLVIVFERFFTLASVPFSGMEIKIYPLDIIFGASLLGMLWHYAFATEKIKIDLPEKILGIFIILNIIYFPLSYLQNSEMALSFSTSKNYVFYSLFYFLIFGLIKNKKDLRNVFKFFLAGATAAIIFFAIGLIRQEGLWTEFNPLSTDGVRLLAFSHGMFMSVALIPLFIYLTFSEKRKLWLNVVLVIWVGGIFGTLMRHLWVALFVSFVVTFAILSWNSKKVILKLGLKLLIPVLLLVAIVSYYPDLVSKFKNQEAEISGLGMVAERAQSITSGDEDSSFYWRSIAWRSGLERFKENPIFGIGTGKRVVVKMKWLTQNAEVRSIHNSYLSIMIQFGIVGLAIFLAFIGITLKKLYSFRNNFSAIAVMSVLIFFLVAAVFQPYLETNLLAIFFWIALGLAKVIPELKK